MRGGFFHEVGDRFERANLGLTDAVFRADFAAFESDVRGDDFGGASIFIAFEHEFFAGVTARIGETKNIRRDWLEPRTVVCRTSTPPRETLR